MASVVEPFVTGVELLAGVVDHTNFADADAFVDPHAIVAAGASVKCDNGLLDSLRTKNLLGDLLPRSRDEVAN